MQGRCYGGLPKKWGEHVSLVGHGMNEKGIANRDGKQRRCTDLRNELQVGCQYP